MLPSLVWNSLIGLVLTNRYNKAHAKPHHCYPYYTTVFFIITTQSQLKKKTFLKVLAAWFHVAAESTTINRIKQYSSFIPTLKAQMTQDIKYKNKNCIHAYTRNLNLNARSINSKNHFRIHQLKIKSVIKI